MINECQRCGHRWKEAYKHRCMNCGYWNIDSYNKVMEGNEIPTLATYKDMYVEKFVTGPWDWTLGGGLVRKSVALIGGTPGAGKSTLISQMIKGFLNKYSEPVAYVSSEENGAEVKNRFLRTGFNSGMLERVYFASTIEQGCDIQNLVLKSKSKLVVLDSLQGLTRVEADQLEICEQLKVLATEQNVSAIVTSQVNKDQDFAGLMATQHAVDSTFELYVDDDIRVFSAVKNRYGAIPNATLYEMQESGLFYTGKESEG
jgi:DNA repair protein RadA/Sms